MANRSYEHASGDSVSTTALRGDSQDHSTSADCFSWEQKPVEDTTKAGSGGTVTGLADYTYNGRDSLFARTEELPEDIITSLEVGLDISITQTITRDDFWNIILHHKIPVTMCLLAVMGLPSTGKTSAIEKMLKEFIQLKQKSNLKIDKYLNRKRNDRCLSIYEMCVLGGLPHDQYAWSFATNRFGALYSIICSLARQYPLITRATFEPTKEGTKLFMGEHVQWLMKQVSIHLENIKDERAKLSLIQDGLSLINVMDIGVNRALYDFLSIMLLSCRKHFRLAFFSLDRDAPDLDDKPDLSHDRYKETNDCNIVMRQRPRLTYLLHFATLGYKKESADAVCSTVMVASKVEKSIHTNRKTTPEELLKQAKQKILERAKKQGVDGFLEEWKIVDLDDINSFKILGVTLQNIIKSVEQFKVELPLRWIVLRSLVTSLNLCHASKSKMIFMHKDSIIEEAKHLRMEPQEVEQFLITFTEFGSILYMPCFNNIKHLVIVDIYEFAQLLYKLFYPSNPEAEYAKRLLKHGIISRKNVNEVLDVPTYVVSYFMQILSSFAMIAEIQSVIIHQKVIKSDVPTVPLYYLPSAKNGQNYIPSGADDDCAFLEVESVNFPANFQACITQGIMNKNKDAVLVATEYCNVSQFQFQSQEGPNVQINMIYEGQKSRLIIRHPSIDASSFDAIVDACSKVLYAFCHCLQRTANRIRDLTYDVAIQCCVDEKCHYLYCDKDIDQCDECFNNLSKNNFRSCWAEAAKKCRELKHFCDEIAKQTLTIEDIFEYGNTIKESDVQKLIKALDLGDYKVSEYNEKQKKITSILLKWEEVNKEMANKAALEKILDEYEILSPLKVKQKEKERWEKLLQLTDNLDCLSLQVAKKELFPVQGDEPQLVNWERFGLRIGVEEDSLSSSETVEVATVAFVGGEFKFPENTVLVSSVYAVIVSKPLLKPLRLEIQHCVDLTGRPGLSKYLKFAIAPVSTPSLPYQFSIIEGGEFSSDSWYGSIQHKEFSLVCILGEETTGGVPVVPTDGDLDEEEEEEQQQQQEEEDEQKEEEQQEDGNEDKIENDDGDSSSESNKTSGPPVASSGTKESVKGKEHHQGQKEKTISESVTGGSPLAVAPLNVTENESEVVTEAKPEADPINKSTGIKEATAFTILVYYEEKGVEDLVTFTAAKDLNLLLQFIGHRGSNVEIQPHVKFHFGPDNEYIELKFDSPQEEPFTGWTIKPHTKPCKLYRRDINEFSEAKCPLPPYCLVSVYGSPNAVPSLHYAVPVGGVADPVTLYIHKSLRTTTTTTPPPLTSTDLAKKVKKVINDVLVSHHALLTNQLPKEALPYLTNQLYAVCLINDAVKGTPSLDNFITEFKASLCFKNELPEIQEHCQKFLNSFIKVGGSYADAAKALHKAWTKDIKTKLGHDFNIKMDS